MDSRTNTLTNMQVSMLISKESYPWQVLAFRNGQKVTFIEKNNKKTNMCAWTSLPAHVSERERERETVGKERAWQAKHTVYGCSNSYPPMCFAYRGKETLQIMFRNSIPNAADCLKFCLDKTSFHLHFKTVLKQLFLGATSLQGKVYRQENCSPLTT